MSNLGLMFHVFLLSSFLAAATANSFAYNLSETMGHHNATNETTLQGIECESCQFVTHKIDTYLFQNEKFMEIVQNEFDNICNLLPDDAKNICYTAVNHTVPSVIESIGDFIAKNGCEEIGICPP